MIRFIPQNAFEDLQRALADMARPMPADVRRLDRAVRAEFARNFARQGSAGGAWPVLAPRTVRERRKLGYGPTPILIRSGSYYRTFAQDGNPNHIMALTLHAGGWALDVGSSDERASTLEFGTLDSSGPRRIPPRPVTRLGEAQKRRIADEVGALLDDIMRRTRTP